MCVSKKTDISQKQAFIFGHLFILANKLQVVCDQYLEKSGLTTKQWLVMAAVQRFGDKPPTLSQVSDLTGSSRQNVKQLAIKLEKNGFLLLYQTPKSVRLYLTDKSKAFWENREIQDMQYLSGLLADLGESELDAMSEMISKILGRIDKMSAGSDQNRQEPPLHD